MLWVAGHGAYRDADGNSLAGDFAAQTHESFRLMGETMARAGASLQDFPTQERLREYDYGPGVGGRLGFTVLRRAVRLFDVSYRVTWLDTVNGAVIRTEDGTVEEIRNRWDPER